MRFVAYAPGMARDDVLSVDGIAPTGPNLSHWPGNRTPVALRADTSTEILLKAIALPDVWSVLKREVVTNNHYDTDGLLSVWAALNPVWARQHSALLCDAAWAGDLSRFTSREAVILDLCVAGLNEHPKSPLASELAGLPADSPERLARVFAHALEHLPELVARPERYRPLWEEGLAAAEAGFEAFESGRAKLIAIEPLIDLVAIQSEAPLAPLAFRTRAPRARTLLCIGRPGRWSYRFRDEIESWFDLQTVRTPARVPLAPLTQTLTK
ncbi:MAG: DUF6687 family protein, partial [Myxococcales bacterium]